MNARILTVVMCSGLVSLTATAAEDAPKKQATKEEIQARLAEHARKKATGESSVRTTPNPQKSPSPVSSTAAPVASAGGASPNAPAQPEAAKVLPKVEVRKGRVTELDRQLEQQNQEIAREKKNAKPTPLDEALNGPKVSKALAIFGGQSSSDRSSVAKERVAMMEEERDMIEAIAQAPTKEEKEELQKTLDSMKAMRRELEKSLR
ncbi:MAG: hypothetical protein ABIV50_10175 [Opitutus sp.]